MTDQGEIGQDTPKEQPQYRERLVANIESSKKAVDALVAYAVENGADKNKFEHLAKVWDPKDYYLIPDDKMPPGKSAITIGGEVFIRENQEDNFQVVFHESIHRAVHLNEKTETSYQEVVAGLYGFIYKKDDEGRLSGLEPLDPSSLGTIPLRNMSQAERSTYLKEWEQTIKNIASLLSEGLTEWTVQRANGLVTQEGEVIKIPADNTYPLDVYMINSMLEGSGLTREEFEALIIETAFSGDIVSMVQKLGDNFPYYLYALEPVISDHRKVSTIGDLKRQMESAVTQNPSK